MKKELIKCLIMLAAGGQWAFAGGFGVASAAPSDAKKVYFLAPTEDNRWMTSVPMISLDGGKTKLPMTVDSERCGWFYYTFSSEHPVTDNVVFMLNGAKSLADAIGVNGTAEEGETAVPIPLQTYYEALSSTNEVFFISERELWSAEGDGGFYGSDPQVDGFCQFNLSAIIYDTDASLHPSFSCVADGGGAPAEGCQMGAQGYTAQQAQNYVTNCIGIHHGIVVDTLGPDKKPHLANTANAKACFPNSQIFEQMFTYTQGVNEVTCFDIPFERAETGRWEFDSDKFTSPGTDVIGGFYPVENIENADVLKADPSQTPVAAARTKRPAQGPVYMNPWLRAVDATLGEDAPRMDLMCNGPGWNKGVARSDCEGLYGNGDDLSDVLPSATQMGYDFVWCWGSYCNTSRPDGWPLFETGTEKSVAFSADADIRWQSEVKAGKGGRNQHFCLESHMSFVYERGQRFSIRGDDDIWVFIDNKLAVDLGGTHFAAPGYVKLDDFAGRSGKLTEGKTYDLDIFLCDRRSPMSNVTIKTDMPVVQKQGMIDIPSKSGTKETHKLVILNNAGGCNSSGRDSIADFTPKYSLILANGDVVMDNLPLGEVSKGCIDLSNKTVPVITKDKCTLASGRYYLVVSYEGMSKKIAFKVAGGELDVATRDAVVIDTNGVLVEGKKYPFVKRALAGEKVPVYISSVADPCQGKESCSDALLMDVSSAAGRSYVLATDDDLNVYVKNSKGKFEILPSGSARTVGASGVDTVYVTVPLVALNKAVETFHVGVAGSTMAAIDFVAPVIRFMKDATTTTEVVIGDDHSVERKVDTYYDFYLAAFMPGEDGTLSFCEECNFPLMLGSSTSSKLELKNDSIAIVKGHAKITLRSTKEYRTSKDASKRNPATIHIEGENPTLIVATFSPIYFSKNSTYEGIKMPEVLASSGFSVRQAGPNTFTIVFGNSGKSVQKFAVMDLMGAVVQKGETHLRETSVSLQNTGTYIIRVGNESRVVNVKVAEGN